MDVVTAPLQPAAVAMVAGVDVAMGGLFLANTAWLLRGGRPGAREGSAAERIPEFP